MGVLLRMMIDKGMPAIYLVIQHHSEKFRFVSYMDPLKRKETLDAVIIKPLTSLMGL